MELRVYDHVHKSLPLDPIRGLNYTHYFSKVWLNIILPCVPRSSTWSFPWGFWSEYLCYLQALQPLSPRSILMSCSYLCSGLSSGLFSSLEMMSNWNFVCISHSSKCAIRCCPCIIYHCPSFYQSPLFTTVDWSMVCAGHWPDILKCCSQNNCVPVCYDSLFVSQKVSNTVDCIFIVHKLSLCVVY